MKNIAVGHISLATAVERLENRLSPLVDIVTINKSNSGPERIQILKSSIVDEYRKFNSKPTDELHIFEEAIFIFQVDLKNKKHKSQIDLLKSHVLLSISYIETLKAKYPQEISTDTPTGELISDLMDTAIQIGKTEALIHLEKIEKEFSKNSKIASMGGKAKNKDIPKLKKLALDLVKKNRPPDGWKSITQCIANISLELPRIAKIQGIPDEHIDSVKLYDRINNWRVGDNEFKEQFDATLKNSS